MNDHDGPAGQDLNQSKILDLLTDLGSRMHEQGLVARLYIVGGAAIALTLKDDRITQDVDAVMVDHSAELRQAALEVGREHGVDQNWMADDITDFVSSSPSGQEIEFSIPGLNIAVASPEHLLAMKVRASAARAETKDADDLVFLAEHVGLQHPEPVARLTASQFEGIYRDNLGYDEYLEAARFAFVQVALRQGEDPVRFYLDEVPAPAALAREEVPARGADNAALRALHRRFPELRSEPAGTDTGSDRSHDSGYAF